MDARASVRAQQKSLFIKHDDDGLICLVLRLGSTLVEYHYCDYYCSQWRWRERDAINFQLIVATALRLGLTLDEVWVHHLNDDSDDGVRRIQLSY